MTTLASRRWMTAAALGVAIGAITLYWPSLTLPVLYDDLLHIRIAKGLNLSTVWQVNDQFGFYRPLSFLPFLIIKAVFGYYPDWLLHGLNVVQHGMNAVLVTTLAWRLWRKRMTAVIAGILFAFFPFSYQAIVVYANNVYPTTAGLMLLGVHTYVTAVQPNAYQASSNRERNHSWQSAFWWVLTALIFALSLLSQESAVVFGALAALAHWNVHGGLPRLKMPDPSFSLRRLPPWVFFILVGVLYAIAFQFLPLDRALPGAGQSNDTLWIRALYMLQAAAYPFTWFAHRLPDVDAENLVMISVAMTTVLTLWTGRERSNRLPLLLGWGWWAAAALVVAVPLPASYLLHGPRLLYLGSVGLALSWSTILTGQKSGVLKYALPIAGTTLILATNWTFVSGRLADYARVTEPIEVIQDVMAAEPADEGVMIVNLPQWLAPARNTFAVGAELAAMLGNHIFADEIVWENLPGEPPVYSVVSSDLLQKTTYLYGVHDETTFRGDAAATLPVRSDWAGTASQVFIVGFSPSGPQTTHAGTFQPSVGAEVPLATLGPYELVEASASLCTDLVRAKLVWRWPSSRPIPSTASVFVQVLSDDGPLLAQADGPPLGLRPDLVELRPGWQIEEQRTLAGISSGRPSSLLLGAYDYATGERFPAYDSEQKPLRDQALPIALTPCR